MRGAGASGAVRPTLQCAKRDRPSSVCGVTLSDAIRRTVEQRSRQGDATTTTTPMLLKSVGSGRLQPRKLVTHRFALDNIMQTYETFEHAAREGALRVILRNGPRG
jgi:threonine dehydrogenase-like Zn-dependent dehydrogenase